MRAVPVHYLRANETVWTPPAVVCLDTETRVVEAGDREVLALRCWVARLTDRRPTGSGRTEDRWGEGATADDLADWLTAACRGRRVLWVYAHNLSFDLATTRLPGLLVARGWTITDFSLSGRAPWIRLADTSHHLTLCDSFSWLPRALESVGELVGTPKPALPADDDTDAAWTGRCRGDVAILSAAVLALMGWWDRHQLGRWTITGAASGWNAYRHIPSPQRVTVDPDPAGIAWDRAAVYGGRRGVSEVGELAGGPWVELDFHAAYPTVAASCPLPVRRSYVVANAEPLRYLLGSDRWGMVAQCVVDCPTPRFPARAGGAVWYPTGRFGTTLAGPELAEAARRGWLVSLGRAYVYQLGAAMVPWARWCLAVADGELADCPPVARAAAKSWGRSVLGKWAAHGQDRFELGHPPRAGWGYEDGWDHTVGERGGMVDLFGRRWWTAAGVEPDNTFPAVYAWVESECRVRLGRALELVGPGAAVQWDTDGIIVNARALGTVAAGGRVQLPARTSRRTRTAGVLEVAAELCEPLALRVKARVADLDVLGPQHYVADGRRRFSGLAGGAVAVAPGVYEARLWPRLAWQLEHGDPRGYVRPLQRATIEGPYAPGWVLADGRVVPPRATTDAPGECRLLPFDGTEAGQLDADLAERQHPALAALLG